jgi:secreted PhoX family phosphatase
MNKRVVSGAVAVALLGIGVGAAFAADIPDFGVQRDAQLSGESKDLFGVEAPIAASATDTVDQATALADPKSLATFAKGLKVRVVTSGVAAPNIDQMALWPTGINPTHLIACNEQGATQAGLQRIDVATGATETILSGTVSCDGVRRTAWGTILFSEESGTSGQTYELIDPLHTTGVTLDRATGAFSGGVGAANLVRRNALGRLSFEGHGLLPNGVMYYGDENRPSNGTAGGAYFKFVPTNPFSGTAPITALDQSPFASGKIFGLRVGFRNGGTDFGQATQTGLGKWISVCADGGSTPCSVTPSIDLRAFSAANKLTGYYRPEDLEVDPTALAAGNVKVCGNNTGNEVEDHTWGETICISDGTTATSLAGTAVPDTQFFVIGSADMAMTDNIAPQPGPAGRWLIVEDGDVQLGGNGKNNDMFLCLRDGADADNLSDGCIRVGTLHNTGSVAYPEGAEWTGPIFSEDGKHLFVSVQHNVGLTGVVLDITGWK